MSRRTAKTKDWGTSYWSSRGAMTGSTARPTIRSYAAGRRRVTVDEPMGAAITVPGRPYNRRRYASRAALNQRTGGLIGIEQKFVDQVLGSTAITASWNGGEIDPAAGGISHL